MDKYKIVGFGGNYFITEDGVKPEPKYSFFHFKTVEEARNYIRDVLLPIKAEELHIECGEDF